ncbi:protease pro-enzyme activation domain-containing protein [Variovorax sp. dw_308]|uniref:S53 family peptidase n=1 Tax=Variovorax sp. dw_308 TaxID=2721546 RepID=UPI001C44CD7E|nr:S53 family peptidase [Variovorax sp. dw_308]
MATGTARVPVPGSDKKAVAGAQSTGLVPDDERIDVTVRIRPRTAIQSLAQGSVQADALPSQRSYLSREEYSASHGADPADIAKVEAFAKAHGLSVVEANVERRSVVLSGDAKSMSAAFGVALHAMEHEGGTYRGRTGSISVPADLADVVVGVFGLDDRPQADPHFQHKALARAFTPRAGSASFTPPALARLYSFPTGLDGSGECIGIIELGGGFRPADIKAYFGGLGLPVPAVKAVLIDGAHNHPTNANGADGEVMLDIEVAAAVAPKAKIAVYFAPNTNQGFLDAITHAVHDKVNKPSVISISWGSAESNWTAQAMTQFDQAFQAAAAMGVTVCCAAGDNGSGDGVGDGAAHVDFPASSPFALGCGGTRLTATAGKITAEVVWNEGTDSSTGGGVSTTFARPAYQANAHVPAAPNKFVGRGVPDVAGDADPASGYEVRVDGQNMVIGGTSAVAPLWAGLIALMNQKIGKPVGFLNPLIYGQLAGKGLFNDITVGNNGAYNAAAGWDACTGWGSPNGAKLLKALGG